MTEQEIDSLDLVALRQGNHSELARMVALFKLYV